MALPVPPFFMHSGIKKEICMFYMYVLPDVCLRTMCMLGVLGGRLQLPCECWELNLDPLQEHQVLSTSEPLLQPQEFFLKSYFI